MKWSKYLEKSTSLLKSSGISTSRLDTLILIEDTTGVDRAWLLAHPEYELTKSQIRILDEQLERRAKHEPLAYIRGKTEFYGREFAVNAHTLEPRPETETMVEILTTHLKGRTFQVSPTTLVDVGTGSGAIAVTIKLLFPEARIYATDIDNKCIQTAETNAEKHNVSIDFRQGNLLEPIMNDRMKEWIVVANLPYVPDSHTINEAAMFEPKYAIFGGEDGLDYYRRMFTQIDQFAAKASYVLTESLPFQHNDLSKIATDSGYRLLEVDDFIQMFGLR